MRIAVIDADAAFNNAFSQWCKKANVSCQFFVQAAAALAELKKSSSPVDLILVSKELPEDGLAVAQALRREPKILEVPYILISSVWGKTEFAKHQKTEFGANAYYSKKNSISELISTIEAVTGSNLGSSLPELTRNSLLNIKLLPATEILNFSEDAPPTGISIEIPITLFPDAAPAVATKSTSIKAPAPPHVPAPTPRPEPSTSAVKLPKASAEKSGGIEISLSETEFKIESSSNSQIPNLNSSPNPNPSPSRVFEISLSDSAPHASSPSISTAPQPVVEIPAIAAAPLPVEDKASDSVLLIMPEIPAFEPPQAPAAPSQEAHPVSEEEAAKDLPYLFAGSALSQTKSNVAVKPQTTTSVQPSNDVETLKKYLTMREQDVSVLTAQLTYAKEELSKCEDTIRRMTLQNEDLFHQINDLKQRVSSQEQELQHAGKSMEGEVDQLRFEVKSKIDRIKFLEDRLNDSAQQYEKLKERVRLDIRKIRVREKELESKLEILKKDSETLISARENKILELKRKIDLLEFNYDTLQDKNELEKENVRKSYEKIERIHKVLKLALGIIEAEGDQPTTEPEYDKAA